MSKEHEELWWRTQQQILNDISTELARHGVKIDKLEETDKSRAKDIEKLKEYKWKMVGAVATVAFLGSLLGAMIIKVLLKT